MGMSASQARLLTITARLTNTEYQAQTIMNNKIRLADESETLNNEYLEALDKKKLVISQYKNGAYVDKDVNYNLLTNYDPTGVSESYMITDVKGRAVVSQKYADLLRQGAIAISSAPVDTDSSLFGGTNAVAERLKKLRQEELGIFNSDDDLTITPSSMDAEKFLEVYDKALTLYRDNLQSDFGRSGLPVAPQRTLGMTDFEYQALVTTFEEQKNAYNSIAGNDYDTDMLVSNALEKALTDLLYGTDNYEGLDDVYQEKFVDSEVDQRVLEYVFDHPELNTYNYDQYGNVTGIDEPAYIVASGLELTSSSWFQSQLESGSLYINRFDKSLNEGEGAFTTESWDSGYLGITEVEDDKEIAKIKAKYESNMTKIKNQEDSLDMDLKKIDTIHAALQTEYESAKKVTENNIDRSYKTFNA